jgi:hypothetical protein
VLRRQQVAPWLPELDGPLEPGNPSTRLWSWSSATMRAAKCSAPGTAP